MRQLYWKLRNNQTEEEIIERHMDSYREVLYQWNDNLNRNLALTLAYFGRDIRNFLEATVNKEFRKIGSLLETAYKDRKGKEKVTVSGTDTGLTKLGYHIYTLNLRMIRRIQNSEVGIFNPDVEQSDGQKPKSKKKE